MALQAMTTADTVKFVSRKDPAFKETKVFNDPADETKGFEMIDETDLKAASVFTLRPLDIFLMGYIYDNASSLTGKQGSTEVGIHTRINQTNIDAVKFSLASIVNFPDKHGQLVHLKTQKAVVNGREYDVADDYTMTALGLQLVSEMADKVKAISEVSAAEEKNSVKAS